MQVFQNLINKTNGLVEFSWFALERRKDVDTRLTDHVNKSLGMISSEMLDYLRLIAVREDGHC